ncbi:polysaccharide pyruvyl transferase family protein [Roseofilum sp. BLCC_M91]|uniref:Polysaccharide pyruvyl transferase family protein n=1 Tax=Roseofilum halophilum BLCC-M91 TaxID=3022259 RepID=A0ABT7BQQ8_9CYAN|nr:polysaccharide pyruvyl transferase family protein [Roseofilum halophilum]MDJ1181415.1 polysaccharide pyruvyl transferase family protein [Roseofilum halophilum BLCC-M91]
MIFEIQGVDFINKGGELMTHAVVQHFADLEPGSRVAAHLRMGTFDQREKTGLYHLSWAYTEKAPQLGHLINACATLIPQQLCHSLKLIRIQEVDAVLDASGFTYSDQQGAAMIEIMAKRLKLRKQEGKKVILLPQAFGPFKNQRVKKAFLEILENSDLVFARDRVSYEYLQNIKDLLSKCPSIKKAPDFTNLVKGKVPEYFKPESSKRKGCIVPNYRMVQRTSSEVKEKYLDFLQICAKYLIEKDIEPFILIHETRTDYDLALKLQAEIGQSLQIIQEASPLYIKGILGNSFLVIGSRFHSLVSTLSQCVPCLGTGWSHKYEMLFDDYDCPECLISPVESEEKVHKTLDRLIEEPDRSNLMNRLHIASQEQKRLTTQMWEEVDQFLQV